MTIAINGAQAELPGDPRVSLLDLLREDLHLFGAKKGCNQGACGACTVLVDGERVLSCLTLAVQVGGRSVTTVEGLALNGELTPCNGRSSSTTASNADTARPGRSARPSAWPTSFGDVHRVT